MSDAGRSTPPNQRDMPRLDTGTLGMWLFIGSLSMLFAASMMGYLVTRMNAPTWPPEGTPRLPAGLWLATLVLLAASGFIHAALLAARRGAQATLRNALLITTALGVVFLVLQALNWRTLTLHGMPPDANLYAFLFYFLTGLHAAHVIGGVVLLGLVTWRAMAGGYTAQRHAGVRYTAAYWHFLDVVWLVMLAVFMIG